MTTAEVDPEWERIPHEAKSELAVRQATVINIDPEIVSGTPVFMGTRVPIKNLIDYLGRGHDLATFLDEFPSVRRESAAIALHQMQDASIDARRRGGESGPSASVIHIAPEILGGTPVFRGTRVPIRALVDYLAAGDPLARFLDHFPSVTRAQAEAPLAEFLELGIEDARAHSVR